MYENYLSDLGFALAEKVSEINEKNKAISEISEYDKGYQMALYEIISLMQQQASAFQIDLEKINLDKINPDRDLL